MSSKSTIHSTLLRWAQQQHVALAFLFVFAVGLYANTLWHQFTQDDALVIYENDLVRRGVDGIKEIFTHDSFYGFFGEEGKSALVSGGRYRPLSLAYFAVLYEGAGPNPLYYHLSSILWYALVAMCTYWLMLRIGTFLDKGNRMIFSLVAALVFVAHPIHTEVVANVKSHDELFSLFFSLLTFLSLYRYFDTRSRNHLYLGGLFFFSALLSKESSLAFAGIIPLTFWFLHHKKPSEIALPAITTLFVPVTFYLALRFSILGVPAGGPITELMNNPFLKLTDGSYVPFSTTERMSSVFMGLAKYLQLLVFPHPLTSDYYPRIWPVSNLLSPAVLAALAMNVSLLAIALAGLRKKSFVTFCIGFFYAGILLVSNIFFPVGTHLSERFLFMPSLSICMLLAYAFVRLKKIESASWWDLILVGLVVLFSIKSVTRNAVWKSDFTLFTTDVRVSKNSAKAQNAAGGALLTRAAGTDDPQQKAALCRRAVNHLNRAIEIHPNYKNAYLLLGNADNYLKNYDRAIRSYETALRLDPYYEEAENNLHLTYREAGRNAGSELNDIDLAKTYLNKALVLKPNDYETNSLLGIAYGNEGDHQVAVEFFEKSVALRPDLARAYVNLGYALLNLGEEEEAQINFQKAVRIDPDALN